MPDPTSNTLFDAVRGFFLHNTLRDADDVLSALMCVLEDRDALSTLPAHIVQYAVDHLDTLRDSTIPNPWDPQPAPLPDVLWRTLLAVRPCPSAALFSSLEIYSHPLSARDADILFRQSPSLCNLSTLTLCSRAATNDTLHALSTSPYLTTLRSLRILHSPATDDAFFALLCSPNAHHLEVLDFTHTDITDTTLYLIASLPQLRTLHTLVLTGTKVTPRGVAALATSAHLSQLKHIDLDSRALSNEVFRLLVSSPHTFPTLRSIGLESTTHTLDLNLHTLLRSPLRTSLQELALTCATPISTRACQTLLSSPNIHSLFMTGPVFPETIPINTGLRALHRLHSFRTSLSSTQSAAFSHALTNSPLQHVWLEGSNFSAEAFQTFISAPTRSHLQTLILGGTLINDEALQTLASTPHLTQLRSLEFRRSPATPASLSAVLQSPFLPSLERAVFSLDTPLSHTPQTTSSPLHSSPLKSLSIDLQPTRVDWLSPILSTVRFPHLETLSLHGTHLPISALRDLLKYSPNLRVFSYTNVSISDLLVRTIAPYIAPNANLTFSSGSVTEHGALQLFARGFSSLQLTHQAISLESPLPESLPSSLHTLDVSANSLDSRGFQYLLHSPVLARVRDFSCTDNPITLLDVIALLNQPYSAHLTDLFISSDPTRPASLPRALPQHTGALRRFHWIKSGLHDAHLPLLRIPLFQRLQTLDLSDNHITFDALCTLLNALPELTELFISGNELTDDETRNLQTQYPWMSIY